jgi:hypothetical protein
MEQCVCGKLLQGMELHTGDEFRSCDGRFWLTLQGDGNLVLSEKNVASPLWAAGTVGKGTAYAIVQDDGNFVAYSTTNSPVWSSGTSGAGCGTALSLQNDGNLVVYNASGSPIWATNTCCH